jgi:hypothetical protein
MPTIKGSLGTGLDNQFGYEITMNFVSGRCTGCLIYCVFCAPAMIGRAARVSRSAKRS